MIKFEGVFDEEYLKQREQFEKDLDAFYLSVASAIEAKEKAKANDKAYGPKFANADLSEKFRG